ncbi:4-hydroxybenzoyl-CoA thioesterase [Rhodococcus zopfii]|uniref:4-hydroxybenzoyl-CoA thioesterase n=1 Tax=Rhodococcus zopfii TaxID=43772 RepID=A0ABU3WMG2_9NOCA|nr:acyl-ACP thioesterase domain-containing protein [Rhodococcus zopfii]MDV2474623.1 4-hydroxybenzoyl-CoA thioesterase [Rhodococcus zopfii]
MGTDTTATPRWTQPLCELPANASPYTTERTVRTGDVDNNQRLRLDGIARYLQDIGTDNLAAVDATRTDPLWIVRRTVIDVHRPARYPQQLRLRRWCDALSTRWANVRVRMDGVEPDGEGSLIETAGFWIDISPTSGTPTRISDPLFEHMSRHAHDTRLRWHAWLSPDPTDADHTATPFPLRVTDIDPFDHVNNATYWHGVEEHLAERGDLQEGPYRAIVEHLRPVVAGDDLTIRAHHEPDALSLWFTVDDQVRAVARVARSTTSTPGRSDIGAPAADEPEHLRWDA